MPLPTALVIRTLSAFLLGSVLLVSCEEAVEIQFDVTRSRLVLSSSFIPDQPVVLQVTATRSRGSVAPAPITDARVSLFEGMELAEELTYFPESKGNQGGTYRTTSFKPQVGRQYTIHVAAPGYDPVSAVSSIPEPVKIKTLAVKRLSMTEVDGTAIYDYHLLVDYADPVDETNYYDLRMSQMVVPFKLNRQGDTIREQPYLKSVSTPVYETSNSEVISILLKDKQNSDIIDVHLQSRLDPHSELLGEVIAELRTVSPEYYFYHRSIARPDELPNSGLKDPVIIYNNVLSGLGVFAGYTSVRQGLNLTQR
ncbi:DUF4249 domain-containing protein [Lewinella sp. IMCC34191]|uniref:DUF4249 domain-containing protein n=1 Tax=Lewinella sp. IMCC34191 TaxID=2259172 RepID=UPI000E250D3D|nr:DUF4249 domain-containing protein [Lewinella sp. IMCC34191]